jgi:hypothetical protein
VSLMLCIGLLPGGLASLVERLRGAFAKRAGRAEGAAA